jgi:peptidyl-dipeptidase A
MRTPSRLASAVLAAALSACGLAALSAQTTPDARTFLETANADMLRLSNRANRAGWVQSTYITPDTEVMSAEATEALVSAVTALAKEAAAFDRVELPPDLRRQLTLLKNALPMAAPPDPKEAEALTRLVTSMEGVYGRGTYCPAGAEGEACLDINEITLIMAENRDPKRLREVWEGWHRIAIPMKDDYARFAELSNRGAGALGFADTGAMWRAKYDMPPDDFARELNRLWDQLRPLYVSLHAYVRARLRAHYGDLVPANGPIPAHLLGNLWQQDWSNIYPLVAPPRADPGYSLTEILRRRKTTPGEMVKIAERFFTSVGFEPLPPTFWERSMFTKPRDREVVCHASAWVVDNVDDLRIKMCIEPTAEDFTTIHHELGHNFYQRAYSRQPMIFRDSANDGFHEAVGDTLALSVTPEYLVKIGLLEKAPPASSDIGLLLRSALERLAFLPFGLLVDQWRWQVFSGEIAKGDYNRAWWDLKLKYQGVAPPSPRGEEFFDPGAKYHVPANTPYSRYFLAAVLQFQFHRALAKAAGCTGPLHRCSIYGSEEAGRRLQAMLELGASRPWPDALEALTGQRQMDATAMADYFAPLKAWLDEQNRGTASGW